MTEIHVATHNMTEGAITPAVAHADVVFGQEVDKVKVRAGLPGHRHFFPSKDPHLSISWDPHLVQPIEHGSLAKVHGSGEHEGDKVRTPRRDIAVKETVVGKVPTTLLCAWPINSAFNHKADAFKWFRRVLWRLYMRRVRALVAKAHEAGAVVILAGDFNRLVGTFTPPGMREATSGRGLDRIFYSDDPRIRLDGPTWEGPITGVGRDLKHKSQHARFEITAGRTAPEPPGRRR